jgi:divalent metal cation (Fe/Co/Zn/Cd) transporter
VAVSLILARESRSLLMGEGIAPDTQTRITALIEKDPHVKKVLHILSTYQSPEEIVLMIVIAFHENLDTSDINEAIERIRDMIKKEYVLVRYILIQPEFYEQAEGKIKIEP